MKPSHFSEEGEVEDWLARRRFIKLIKERTGKQLVFSESEVYDFFVKHYRKFGFRRIIRHDVGKGCDLIMEDSEGNRVRVEIEVVASSYKLHPEDYADVVVCAWKDTELPLRVIDLSKWLIPWRKLEVKYNAPWAWLVDWDRLNPEWIEWVIRHES